ncbi:MAG: nucleotidyltransferase domain-containing protein [Polyangiaceae bacterium]|nr:nucleotidyltransferase domain-containing protein [Polyangiaceae bacterium]
MTKKLPAAAEMKLGELAKTLENQLGKNLVSLLAYGSVARGGWVEGRSDVDLVLVLKDPSPKVLLSIANTLTIARTALQFETMILKEDEIHRAADVFPLFYDDIRSCHVLLAGKDAFANLEISDAHRRVRIEQELREVQIRLRRAVVDSLGSESHVAGAIERKIKQIRGPVFALLALRKTPAANDELKTVLAKAHEVWNVDVAPMQDVRKDPPKALDALNDLLWRMIDEVDRMEG